VNPSQFPEREECLEGRVLPLADLTRRDHVRLCLTVSIGILNRTPTDGDKSLLPIPETPSAFIRSHDAVIRVYDDAGNVIETHEHKGDFKER
jgi:hypothetical protein